MKVVVTGAAGQIAYSLVPFLCEEGVFSSSQKIDLKLVEIPQAMERLNGFVKELEDSAYSTVNSISTFDNIISSGSIDAIKLAVTGLKSQYDAANGVEGKMVTGKTAPNNGDVFRSQAELVRAMNDSRYDSDPAYRQDVIEKLDRSDLEF